MGFQPKPGIKPTGPWKNEGSGSLEGWRGEGRIACDRAQVAVSKMRGPDIDVYTEASCCKDTQALDPHTARFHLFNFTVTPPELRIGLIACVSFVWLVTWTNGPGPLFTGRALPAPSTYLHPQSSFGCVLGLAQLEGLKALRSF